jgi:hypothetical protein
MIPLCSARLAPRPPRFLRNLITPLGLGALLALGLASSSALADGGAGGAYEAAAVKAAPGLSCRLHPSAAPADTGIKVFTDHDGYARFMAVRSGADDATAAFTLACANAKGVASAYPVDLASEATFAPRPVDLSKEPGVDRPALKGDPMNYRQADLLAGGYGVRPDPVADAADYAKWLAAARQPARLLGADRALGRSHTVTAVPGNLWSGSVLTGKPLYNFIVGGFGVPKAIPGGDSTRDTIISVWLGLGGYGTGSGLIQAGIDVDTTPQTAQYFTFVEYCCGDPNGSSAGNFNVNPGDNLFIESWYCNTSGTPGAPGLAAGYGCVFVHDTTSGAVMSCTSPTAKPCPSVKPLPFCSVSPKAKNCMTIGKAAEFVVENDSPQASTPAVQFTPFQGSINMSGSATSGSNSNLTISTDPQVTVLTDWTNTTTHMLVFLGATNETYFTVEPTQTSYAFYCKGPLSTGPASAPATNFKWASKGAGISPPAAGQCAWADRGPSGAEIKTGNGNTLFGYLNQFANLPAGKYMKLGVYRDSALSNDMVVRDRPISVTPPFSTSNAPPPQ